MADRELLVLNESTPQIIAPSSVADRGITKGGMAVFTSKDVIPNIATIAALRAFTGTPPTIYLACHTTAGDGGCGVFRYVSGAAPATYVDNNVTIIVPTGGDGSAAWLREWSGAVLQFTTVKKLAKAIYLTVASSGSNGIQILSNVQNNFTTGDFSVTWLGGLLDYTSGAAQILFSKYDGSLGYRGGISSTGYPYIIINASTYTATAIAPVVDGNVPRIDWAITRETASVAGQVIFICNGAQLGASVTIPVSGTSMSNASNLYLSGTSTTRTAGLYLETMIRNNAITASEALAEITNGVAFSSVNASMTAAYTSDFSAGVDGWAVVSSSTTITGNIDGIGGEDNTFRIVALTTAARTSKTSILPSGNAKCYNISFKIYHSGNVTATGVRLLDGNGTAVTVLGGSLTSGGYAISVSGVWTTFRARVQISSASTSTGVQIRLASADANPSSTVGDTVYMKDFVVNPSGIVGHWSSEDVQNMTGQIIDISGNKNHALLPSAGATLYPSSRGGQIRGTNTWAATSETQYVTGINQAHMNAATAFQNIDIISSGAVTVNIGDGSDVDRFGASISLSTGRNRVTLLTPFVDGTNLKLTLTPTGAFTGTLETTATFTILED